MTKVRKLSDEEYVSGGGTHCPFCGSEDITGSSVEVDSGVVTQGVSCSACGEDWTDVYRLISTDIKAPLIDHKAEWESPSQALEWIREQSDPLEALKKVVEHNIEAGEYGFAAELIQEFGGTDVPTANQGAAEVLDGLTRVEIDIRQMGGNVLNWAVAEYRFAELKKAGEHIKQWVLDEHCAGTVSHDYVTNPLSSQPLIEGAGVSINHNPEDDPAVMEWSASDRSGAHTYEGETMMIAGLRALLAGRYGPKMWVPAVLLSQKEN